MTALELITNPVFIGFASAGAMTVAAAIAGFFIKRDEKVKTIALGLADYLAKLREIMQKWESAGLPGPAKLDGAMKDMSDWLESVGVKGDARRVTLVRIQSDIEWLVPLMYAKTPALPLVAEPHVGV